MLTRAHSVLTIKALDEAQRVIEGVATTPLTDHAGDVVEPLGGVFKLPLPLLWQHGKDPFVGLTPVGHVVAAKPTASGIPVRIQMERTSEPGRLKEILDFAWQAVHKQLMRGLSIGFNPLEQEPIKGTFGSRFKRWQWLELSVVAVPANQDASISLVKSLDSVLLALSGTSARVPSLPGVSGVSKASAAMTYSEQIASEKADLQTKSARLEALMTQEDTQGGLSAEESTERDTLTSGIQAQTKKIERLAALEAAQMAQAKAVQFEGSTGVAAPARPKVEVVNLEKGTRYTRYAMAVAAGKGSYSDTLAYARRWDGQTPEVSAYIKALAGTTADASPGWGAELYNPNAMVTEFAELLRPATIIGRTPGLRTVPVGIPVITQTGGSTFAWVGETGSKPVSELAFSRTTTARHKVAGIVVLSEELVRYGRPDAEAVVRRDLVEQCARFLDAAFIQVAKTAGANNPASITQGVASPAASGTTLSDLQYDLNVALATFDTAGIDTSDLVIATTPALARGISMLTNPLGQSPNGFSVTPNGGTLLGYPVIVSSSVDSGTIVIFKPSEILLSGGDSVRLDASNQATLDMDGGSPATATFSLWQNNCVGLRAEQFITWLKRRAGVVAVIDTAAYGPSVGSP